jgi:hypothetical protein
MHIPNTLKIKLQSNHHQNKSNINKNVNYSNIRK